MGYAYVALMAAKHGVVKRCGPWLAETPRPAVTVNAVCLGFVDTDMLEELRRASSKRPAAARRGCPQEPRSTNPQGRFIQPARCDGAVVLQRSGRLHHRPGDLGFGGWHGERAAFGTGHIARQQGTVEVSDQAATRFPHHRGGIARAVEEAIFDTTLPRSDVMAALYRQADGMPMSDLSRFLLVSNGNAGRHRRPAGIEVPLRARGAMATAVPMVRLTTPAQTRSRRWRPPMKADRRIARWRRRR